jgi:hypothetical protein
MSYGGKRRRPLQMGVYEANHPCEQSPPQRDRQDGDDHGGGQRRQSFSPGPTIIVRFFQRSLPFGGAAELPSAIDGSTASVEPLLACSR